MTTKPTYKELEQKAKGLEKEVAKHKKREEVMWNQAHKVREQVKELNCLYDISTFIDESDSSVEEILQGIVNLIPPAWKYPDITCARIISEGKEFRTENFRETTWKQVSEIRTFGKTIGTLEVYYLEEKAERDEGPFLKEERKLLAVIAGRLGRITERKQAQDNLTASLKEKELLLKEVHHRAKNNFQIIASLLNLQSQRITDKASRAMFQESQNRVRSMALIHEKLYTSEDLAHIDIAAYVHDLTASLFSTCIVSNEIKMNIDVTDDIFCTITTAIPCGLIINELVTNALKHAFPKERDGTITVSMTPSTNDSLILTVSDTGIGFPEAIDFNNTTTLGMQLVTSLVEQVEGTITFDRNEGTTFTITFRGGGLEYKRRDIGNGKSTDTDC